MPRYFIDSDDGVRLDRDEVGHDLPDAQAARRAALRALPDMARDGIPNGDEGVFTVSVRDESDTVLYEASLVMKGAWKVAPLTGRADERRDRAPPRPARLADTGLMERSARALSDEVDTGSAQESAARQELGAVPDCNVIGHRSKHHSPKWSPVRRRK